MQVHRTLVCIGICVTSIPGSRASLLLALLHLVLLAPSPSFLPASSVILPSPPNPTDSLVLSTSYLLFHLVLIVALDVR